MTINDPTAKKGIGGQATTRQTNLAAYQHSQPGQLLADGGTATRPRQAEAEADGDGEGLPAPPAYEAPGEERRSWYADSGRYGVMFAGDYNWNNVQCTAEAYGDARAAVGQRAGTPARSLYFHTEWVRGPKAATCLKKIGGYNRFNPGHVVSAVSAIRDATDATARFVVGRESSPVLYMWTDRPQAAYNALADCGSDEYYRREALKADLREIQEARGERGLILEDPAETTGRLKEILTELNELETFAPGAPDELGAAPRAEAVPGMGRREPIEEIDPGTPTAIRAWWD